MSSRRSRRTSEYTSRESLLPRFFLGFLVVLTGIILLLYLYVSSAFSNRDSLRVVVGEPGGQVKVLIFDLAKPEATVLSIPPETQVSVARQLGTWRLGSVWQLGTDEGDKGGILADTIMKTFGIPIEDWAGEGVLGYISPNVFDRIRSAFGIYESSLSLRERLALGVISLQIRSGGVGTISMENFPMLKKETLKDGTDGYVVRGSLPSRIVGLFSDDAFVNEEGLPLRIRIVDAAKFRSRESIVTVQNVSEVLGAKVVSIDENTGEDFGCIVSLDESLIEVSARISELFHCDIYQNQENDVDVEFRFGDSFTRKF